MKMRFIARIICIVLLMILLLLLVLTAYFILIDIESKVPEEVEKNYTVQTKEFIGRNVFIIKPNEERKINLKILYFHGGAYVAEMSKEHWDFIGKIAEETGATIILPDYPLTPKYNYKDVFRMAIPLYKEIIEKVDTRNLILMGDSAGGGISLALLEKISEEGINQPKKTILISPWLDVTLTNEKIEEIQKFDTDLNKETLKIAGISYAGEDGMDKYYVNPIKGPLEKIKNVIVYTGTYDILNPDTHILQEKARSVGNDIILKEYEEAKHIWIIKHNSDEELTQKAYNELLKDLIN